MKEHEFDLIAGLVKEVFQALAMDNSEKQKTLEKTSEKVRSLATKFPLYQGWDWN